MSKWNEFNTLNYFIVEAFTSLSLSHKSDAIYYYASVELDHPAYNKSISCYSSKRQLLMGRGLNSLHHICTDVTKNVEKIKNILDNPNSIFNNILALDDSELDSYTSELVTATWSFEMFILMSDRLYDSRGAIKFFNSSLVKSISFLDMREELEDITKYFRYRLKGLG